ncbi:GIY-YIG nuclease family protein [Mesonia aquimarina]|uniref:GIY-YIG nuclease family protein n=1 Tax=Mesonia aquimarina TaxID=1504967 RepID=UPI000EF5A4A2|nr:GIY-YIG nuclease family protein [Mesonia aquimarina]
MKLYYVYIVECLDSSYYIGVTSNVFERVEEHNIGMDKDSYTYLRRPVKLKWYAAFTDVNLAILKEKQLKGWTRKKKEALINKDWERLKEYAKNYTQHQKGNG